MNTVKQGGFFQLIVKYVTWHQTLFARLYSMAILKCSPKLFCVFFNLSAAIRRVDMHFSYDTKTKRFTAKSSQLEKYFYHRKQAEMAYRNGFRKRAHQIGDAYLLPKIVFSTGDLVVDCGANLGDLKLYFDEIQIDVDYVAFEPSPLEFICLADNVKPSIVHNKGLWNHDSHLTFYISSQGADSSFIKPPTYDEERKIPTVRLDGILNRPIKLLKLEAEGAEPEVLLGAEGLLDRIEYISADLGFERGIDQQSTLAPVTNFLLDKNFELLDVKHDRIAALFRNKSL